MMMMMMMMKWLTRLQTVTHHSTIAGPSVE